LKFVVSEYAGCRVHKIISGLTMRLQSEHPMAADDGAVLLFCKSGAGYCRALR
jgi:hypothetical protein